MSDRIAAIIAAAQKVPLSAAGSSRLTAMLSQNAQHFAGLSTAEAERARGLLLAEFARRPLISEAADVIREELRTSQSAIVLAGAARGLRGLHAGDPEWRALLMASAQRIAARDEFVRWVPDHPGERTACEEIKLTLEQWDAPRSRCCHGKERPAPSQPHHAPQPFTLDAVTLGRVRIEDQDGKRQGLLDLLAGHRSIVGFFYTRCMNPAKCSLTVTRLAALARQLAQADDGEAWRVLAITYDPRFDTPARLRDFGAARDFPYADNSRLIRCSTHWKTVREALRLQVGYGASTVNEHARECFIISPQLTACPIGGEALTDPIQLRAHALQWGDAVFAEIRSFQGSSVQPSLR